MRLRYDVIRLSLFRSLSNRRTRVLLAGVLSPIPYIEAVARTDRVSYLFAAFSLVQQPRRTPQ